MSSKTLVDVLVKPRCVLPPMLPCLEKGCWDAEREDDWKGRIVGRIGLPKGRCGAVRCGAAMNKRSYCDGRIVNCRSTFPVTPGQDRGKYSVVLRTGAVAGLLCGGVCAERVESGLARARTRGGTTQRGMREEQRGKKSPSPKINGQEVVWQTKN